MIKGKPEHMNVLSFDIEEWYTYQLNPYGGKEYYLPTINKYLDSLLNLLDEREFKATFFCLGIIAREYPEVIRKIADRGHEIGCHSDKHLWLNQMKPENLYEDTRLALDSLQNVTGTKVCAYRAPAFSIGRNNLWTLSILSECGISIDCSIFPSSRSFGGFPDFNYQEPCLIKYSGIIIKEFPITTLKCLGKDIAYSGGGYFRLVPYSIIKKTVRESDYVMSYFHIRDLDKTQKKRLDARYFQLYYGINRAYDKLTHFLTDFQFTNIHNANELIDWDNVPVIHL